IGRSREGTPAAPRPCVRVRCRPRDRSRRCPRRSPWPLPSLRSRGRDEPSGCGDSGSCRTSDVPFGRCGAGPPSGRISASTSNGSARRKRMTLEIIPVSPVCGAEVRGIDMKRPLDPAAAERLDRALAEFGVLVFRGQPLSPVELTAFARHFGPLQPHVQRKYQHPEAPEVVIMTNRKPDGSFDDAGAHRGAMEETRDGWHSDLSYDPVPAKATLLHSVEVPSRGGNTCFANVAKLYADLPDELKARIDGRQAEFWYGGHSRNKKTMLAASAL